MNKYQIYGEIQYLEEYQRELRSVGNDLSKSAKAKLRKLKQEVENDER